MRETCRTGAEKTFAFLKIPLDKNREMVYNICVRMGVRGYSLMVKLQLPKLATRVRFPLPAPIEKGHLRMSFFIGMNYRCEKSLQTARIPSHIYTVGAVCCRTCSAGFRFPLPAPKRKDVASASFFFFHPSSRTPASLRHIMIVETGSPLHYFILGGTL